MAARKKAAKKKRSSAPKKAAVARPGWVPTQAKLSATIGCDPSQVAKLRAAGLEPSDGGYLVREAFEVWAQMRVDVATRELREQLADVRTASAAQGRADAKPADWKQRKERGSALKVEWEVEQLQSRYVTVEQWQQDLAVRMAVVSRMLTELEHLAPDIVGRPSEQVRAVLRSRGEETMRRYRDSGTIKVDPEPAAPATPRPLRKGRGRPKKK